MKCLFWDALATKWTEREERYLIISSSTEIDVPKFTNMHIELKFWVKFKPHWTDRRKCEKRFWSSKYFVLLSAVRYARNAMLPLVPEVCPEKQIQVKRSKGAYNRVRRALSERATRKLLGEHPLLYNCSALISHFQFLWFLTFLIFLSPKLISFPLKFSIKITKFVLINKIKPPTQ